jgi:hypothetical protein
MFKKLHDNLSVEVVLMIVSATLVLYALYNILSGGCDCL